MASAMPVAHIDADEKMHVIIPKLPTAGLSPGVIAYNFFCSIFIHAAAKPICASPHSIPAAMLGILTTFLASGIKRPGTSPDECYVNGHSRRHAILIHVETPRTIPFHKNSSTYAFARCTWRLMNASSGGMGPCSRVGAGISPPHSTKKMWSPFPASSSCWIDS